MWVLLDRFLSVMSPPLQMGQLLHLLSQNIDAMWTALDLSETSPFHMLLWRCLVAVRILVSCLSSFFGLMSSQSAQGTGHDVQVSPLCGSYTIIAYLPVVGSLRHLYCYVPHGGYRYECAKWALPILSTSSVGGQPFFVQGVLTPMPRLHQTTSSPGIPASLAAYQSGAVHQSHLLLPVHVWVEYIYPSLHIPLS